MHGLPFDKSHWFCRDIPDSVRCRWSLFDKQAEVVNETRWSPPYIWSGRSIFMYLKVVDWPDRSSAIELAHTLGGGVVTLKLLHER